MEAGDTVWLITDGSTLGAKFVEAGSPSEAVVDPSLGVPRDIAWVEIVEGEEEGSISRAFYRQIKPRNDGAVEANPAEE